MARLAWVLFFVMSLINIILIYQFMLRGETKAAPDGRTVILLEASERTFFLSEMRSFLVAIQEISEGIEKDDMAQIARAARKVGSADLAHVPPGLMTKLPLATKKMGLSTHQSFDQIAMDAESLGDKEHTLSQLNQLLPICTGCHALYQIQKK